MPTHTIVNGFLEKKRNFLVKKAMRPLLVYVLSAVHTHGIPNNGGGCDGEDR